MGGCFAKMASGTMAAGDDPNILAQSDKRGVHEVPKLRPIIERMRQTSWQL